MHHNGTQPHLLCVNHAPEILELLRTLLEDEHYRVSTLTAIEHDLEAVVALAPNLIIIDYLWATSDNEWTFLHLLTIDRRTHAIPVILCTGALAEVQPMEQHLASVGVTVVYKPFDIATLLGAVQEVLAHKWVTDPNASTDA